MAIGTETQPQQKTIEMFFLTVFLSMSIVGTLLALLANIILYPQNHAAIIGQCVALLANVLAFIIRKKYQTVSVLMLTSLILGAIAYVSLKPTHNATTTLTVILLCGFIHSVMLKNGWLLWLTHVICAACVMLVFTSLVVHPNQPFAHSLNRAIPAAVSYSILYSMLTYTTTVLKSSYDRLHQGLHELNRELYQKANEIEAQNEELIQIQEHLSDVNRNLEDLVTERTAKIQRQNDVLVKHASTNAHQLRGPVARLLGLAAVYKIDPQMDSNFLVEKMLHEAHEIDKVVQQINTDLESGNVSISS